ncbi:MAG: SLC26A/SulP transporter family protein [Betaproteobacteria bacterium]|nr:SLC26A/SulP transporter family protein [Betaproteobacteria bacterium]MCC7217234.1 SLC26A/SulP transporter family protein [Burkholderiales bacterium]
MTDHGATAAEGNGGFAELAREAGAGISAAFVLVAMMLPLGLIAFAPLGEYAVEAGLTAAFACAIFGNITALLLSGALLPNEVPRASSVFLFAAFILRISGDAQLRASPSHGVVEILFLAALCLALTGVIQVSFGLLRLGNIARFVPYPVVAGLMTGLAISLVIYELPEVLGTHGGGAPGAEGGDAHHGINGWTLLVGVVTIVGFVFVRRRWPALPSKLIGLAAGTAVAAIITYVAHGDVGPRVPFLGKVPLPDALLPVLSGDGVALALRFGYDLLVTALAIAVVGSLDSLLAAVGEADGPLDTAHHPNRLLVALGCGNLVSSLFGGVPVAYSSHHALQVHHGGGRKLVSSVATTATLVLLLLYGAPLLHLIPIAALSAMMLVIAVGLIDRWAGATIDRVRRGQYDNELIVNIALVVLVAGVTIVFGLVAAVITGLILSMGLFLAVMNRSLIRSVRTGATRGSRRVYPPEQASLLRVEGHRIKLIELDGAIFFGTADRLAFEAMRAAEGAQYLILDLRRVTMIDASGALMLAKLKRLLQEQKVTLLLAHLSATSRLGRAIQGAGVFTQRHHTDWFEDADRALEWAERQLLAEARVATPEHELAIGEFALLAGLSPDELQFMKPYLDRQLFPSQAALYHEGQQGDRLYLLAKGAVSIVAEDPEAHGRNRRIVTLAPGVIFGESAMIEGGVRSVTAIAENEVVTYSLSRANLDAVRARAPDLYRRIVLNMVNHMSGLLRMTTGILRDTSESVE